MKPRSDLGGGGPVPRTLQILKYYSGPDRPTSPVECKEGGIVDDHIIDIDELPELETSVAAHGSSVQQEIGGAQCVAILIINPPSS